MPLFSKQTVFCMNCGKEHQTDFFIYGGELCSEKCFKELELKKIRSLLGQPNVPSPGEVIGKPG